MVAQSYQEIAGTPERTRRVNPEPPRPIRSPWVQQLAMAGRFAGGQRMNAAPYQPEVVLVYEQFRLIDAESYQRVYSRKDGRPLARGYYFVTWAGDRDGPTFGDTAVFHGPFRTKAEAEGRLATFQATPSPDTQVARNRAVGWPETEI